MKDASSTAIYGARGANGVVMVQTKSGSAGSMFMEALGFKKIHRKTGNGWKVIEMRPDEIENNQKMDGSENIPPGDLPF